MRQPDYPDHCFETLILSLCFCSLLFVSADPAQRFSSRGLDHPTIRHLIRPQTVSVLVRNSLVLYQVSFAMPPTFTLTMAALENIMGQIACQRAIDEAEQRTMNPKPNLRCGMQHIWDIWALISRCSAAQHPQIHKDPERESPAYVRAIVACSSLTPMLHLHLQPPPACQCHHYAWCAALNTDVSISSHSFVKLCLIKNEEHLG